MKHSLNREELIEQLKELAAGKEFVGFIGAQAVTISAWQILWRQTVNMPTLPSSIDLSSFPQR